MTEGRLRNLEIRKAKRHEQTEHLVIDIGSARAHISLADGGARQASVTVHDSERQASIILDPNEEIGTVVHEDGIDAIEDTKPLHDPMAVTSAE
jgi:hypothetical protein